MVLPREVAAHLDWMAQRGRAATTAYDRERLLARLAAWLDCYRDRGNCGEGDWQCDRPPGSHIGFWRTRVDELRGWNLRAGRRYTGPCLTALLHTRPARKDHVAEPAITNGGAG